MHTQKAKTNGSIILPKTFKPKKSKTITKTHFLVNPHVYEKRLEGNYFNASQFSKDSNRPALSSILL